MNHPLSSMRAVFALGTQLAAKWRAPLSSPELTRLRHLAPESGSQTPARSRPLPPAIPGDLAWQWACDAAAALGYAVSERELPEPKQNSAGFTVREHAAIFLNPVRPGGADYPDRQLLRAEIALTLIHELVHAVDPDEHQFSHSGWHEAAPDAAVLAQEAAAAQASEIVAILAAEALAWHIASEAPVASCDGCGGSQLRYLSALLRKRDMPTGSELDQLLARADESVQLLVDAARSTAWTEPAVSRTHAMVIGRTAVPLRCGPAAHAAGPPPHRAASVAAHWSRRRSACLAERARPLKSVLAARDNDHRALVAEWEEANRRPWHEAISSQPGSDARISIVIPARNRAYSIGRVLDALRAQTHDNLEVVVVDDDSEDETREIACRHPVKPRVISLPRRSGAGAARNVGIWHASGDTILFLDADMVIPPNAAADIAARASSNALLIGFFEEVRYKPGRGHVMPGRPACPEADYRVLWRRGKERMIDSGGKTVDTPEEIRLLRDTQDLVDLGFARQHWMWDLPRTVLGKVFALPREIVIEVGGFHPAFHGWGCEESHLAALVIASGLKVIPVLCVTGYHFGEPDAAGALREKLRTWPANLAEYHRLLDSPMEIHGADLFAERVSRVLNAA